MRRQPQATRLALAVLLVLAMAAGSNPASAATQLFKCVIDKRTIYQQQACPVTAEPVPAAASAPPATATPAPRTAHAPASAAPRSVKPASRPASVPATRR